MRVANDEGMSQSETGVSNQKRDRTHLRGLPRGSMSARACSRQPSSFIVLPFCGDPRCKSQQLRSVANLNGCSAKATTELQKGHLDIRHLTAWYDSMPSGLLCTNKFRFSRVAFCQLAINPYSTNNSAAFPLSLLDLWLSCEVNHELAPFHLLRSIFGFFFVC